jgi:hypothetical protein
VHRGVVGQRRELGEIGGSLAKSLPAIDARAQQADAFEDGLRALAVVPQIGTPGVRL